MPVRLLPKSAEAFAPRSAPEIVLNTEVPCWLTKTLKRVSGTKRSFNSVSQRSQYLKQTLGASKAIWTLCSLLLLKAPDADLRKNCDALVEALHNYQFLHVEAYVVHVDMVSAQEVAFKLTPETIERLIEYHADIYSVDASADTPEWPGKESQVKSMQDDFRQSVNQFVLCTRVSALEGMEKDGSGELIQDSKKAKRAIMELFLPLVDPRPSYRLASPLRSKSILCEEPRVENTDRRDDDTELGSLAQHNPSLYDPWCSLPLYFSRHHYDMCPIQNPPPIWYELVNPTMPAEPERQIGECAC
ncbi:hypothetical protein M409DRAFT_61677 [Zasmidium cellare ATCC 36951]|uniref:Uncharacterized protein n=1 Tax=Zasmidium cellare ATCC 36951 TaxID=1080233 RepID=A0A6A6BWJ1_ZASCE|nr:uncharacterized protein M409DRAFT_61677 [Zasmidium cellare ATCC 36951]KAF2158408.1 hypothetical protein M409DRAFT_61677 [Zasmidium cellare ATCC 36951]